MPSHQTGRPLWKVRCASRAIAAVDCLHALHHLTMHLSSQCLLSLKQPLSPALSTAGGQSWSSSAAGLVVRVRSISNDTGSAAAAVVSVCRRAGPETVASCLAGSDNDCNGLAGRDDPSRSRLLPPAPVAVGAVPRKHVRRVPPTQRWAARGSSRRLGSGRKCKHLQRLPEPVALFHRVHAGGDQPAGRTAQLLGLIPLLLVYLYILRQLILCAYFFCQRCHCHYCWF